MPLQLGTLLLAWAIAMVLWGMAHGTSSIERGVDIPIVFDGISEELVLVDQSARAVNIRVMGSRAALRRPPPSRTSRGSSATHEDRMPSASRRN